MYFSNQTLCKDWEEEEGARGRGRERRKKEEELGRERERESWSDKGLPGRCGH